MASLPKQVVPWLEVSRVDAKEEMKNWVQDVAGVLSGKVRSRFNGDNDQPEDGGDPCLKKVLPGGVQGS